MSTEVWFHEDNESFHLSTEDVSVVEFKYSEALSRVNSFRNAFSDRTVLSELDRFDLEAILEDVHTMEVCAKAIFEHKEYLEKKRIEVKADE